jgi:hypothetical protein
MGKCLKLHTHFSFIGTASGAAIGEASLNLLSVIDVGSSSSSESKIRNLKPFNHWRACIFSGLTVEITKIEGVPVSLGWCNKKMRKVDFGLECPPCKEHKLTRDKPKHVRNPTRRARIGTARRRSVAKRKEVFNIKVGNTSIRKNERTKGQTEADH